MSLVEQFDVIPDGVSRIENEVYANFKMIVSFERPSAQKTITKQDWDDITKRIDDTKWSWELTNNYLRFFKNHDKNKVVFRLKNLKKEYLECESFKFGQEYVGGENCDDPDGFHDAFDQIIIKDEFGAERNLYWPGKGTTRLGGDSKKMQFPLREQSSEQVENSRGFAQDPVVLGDQHAEFLSRADAFAKKSQLEFQDQRRPLAAGQKYNLEVIYGNLMDDAPMSEIRFGVVRQFQIRLSELTGLDDIEFPYTIMTPDTRSDNPHFKIIIKGGKFYNGLGKIFFEKSDFAKVFVNYSDPFNNYLNSVEQKVSHPDGIYVIVKYGEDESTKQLVDPFEELPFAKGFNVVVKSTDKKYYSLSPHSKKYKLISKHNDDYEGEYMIDLTSGVLSPQAEVIIDGGKIRNNLLFSWRGDNLLVNREVSDQERENSKKYSTLETQQDSEIEGQFVDENIFQKTEKLVSGTQLQLTHDPQTASSDYTFIVRGVSPTGHHIPIESEITEDERDYVLTLEHYIGSEGDSVALATAQFDLANVEKVPIKNLNIVGDQDYETGSKFVDNKQHFVLNKTLGETEEIRSVFPASVKFEDFRYQAFLTTNRLLRRNENRVSEREFVNRCISYQKRAAQSPPHASPNDHEKINYLADLRCKYLMLAPADVFTHNAMKKSVETDQVIRIGHAFDYNENKDDSSLYQHPFYKKTKSSLLRLATDGGGARVEIERKSTDPELLFETDSDGVYSFKAYATDERLSLWTRLEYYAGIDLKTSVVNYPQKPELTADSVRVYRYSSDEQRNRFFSSFKLKKDSLTWKSIKYLESKSEFLLIHDDTEVQDIKSKYLVANPSTPSLMNEECPYEMFLREVKEGNLKSNIYPKSLELKIRIINGSSSGTNAIYDELDYYFKLKLTKEETLTAKLQNGVIDLVIGDTIIDSLSSYGDEDTHFLTFEFDEYSSKYEILKEGSAIHRLDELIEPELSVRDFDIDERLMDFLNVDSSIYQLDLTRSDEYIFVVDEADPHAKSKEVTLFASTAFQAYFPQERDELSIGTIGDKLQLEIPNNIKPSIPSLDADLLHVKTIDDTWGSPNINIKIDNIESVTRVLLDQNFMEEGKNKLGIILGKVDAEKSEEEPSEFGEDITKLTNVNWSTYDLDRFIDFDHEHEVVGKYFDRNTRKYFKIQGAVYHVLECTPYYNTNLKQWQVIIPFKINRSETMFVKLAAIKIAPGYGLRLMKPNKENSSTNPYLDTTNTILSDISKSVQLPVYNQKRTIIEKTGSNVFTINDGSQSIYEDKQYYIAVKQASIGSVLLTPKNSEDQLMGYEKFKYSPADGQDQEGKVLRVGSLKDIRITIPGNTADSILIMEFEVHDNAIRKAKPVPPILTDPTRIVLPDNWRDFPREFPEIPRNPFPDVKLKKSIKALERKEGLSELVREAEVSKNFVDYNPLFEAKGLRLINISEFGIND